MTPSFVKVNNKSPAFILHMSGIFYNFASSINLNAYKKKQNKKKTCQHLFAEPGPKSDGYVTGSTIDSEIPSPQAPQDAV